MKILFINPYINSPVPNIGLAHLIQSVRDSNIVRLFDLACETKGIEKKLKKKILEFKPDLVGISANSFVYGYCLLLANLIKIINPEIKIIFGGAHSTIMSETVIQEPSIDGLCIGEGEISFNNYLKMEGLKEEVTLDGFWYKSRNGHVIKGGLQKESVNLDRLEFLDWKEWNLDYYLEVSPIMKGVLPVLASRGCPFNCKMCGEPSFRERGIRHRVKKVERVVEEINFFYSSFYEKGLRGFYFLDNTFGMLEQFENFCNLYVNNGLHHIFPWYCQVRANMIDRKWVQYARKAGCMVTSFGIESGDNFIRNKVYNKGISQKSILSANDYLVKARLPFRVSFLFGSKEENRFSAANSLKLLKKINPLTFNTIALQLLPKSALERDYKQKFRARENLGKKWNNAVSLESGPRLKKILVKLLLLQFKLNAFGLLVKNGFQYGRFAFLMDLTKEITHPSFIYRVLKQDPYIFVKFDHVIGEFVFKKWKKRYQK